MRELTSGDGDGRNPHLSSTDHEYRISRREGECMYEDRTHSPRALSRRIQLPRGQLDHIPGSAWGGASARRSRRENRLEAEPTP